MNLFNSFWIWRKKRLNHPVENPSGGRQAHVHSHVDVVPKSVTIGAFARIFTDKFHHLRQPLDWEQLEEMQENRFAFLNRPLEINPQNWDHRYHSLLWNFHLHSFDYALWAARAFVENHEPAPLQHCQSLIEWWIKLTAAGRGDGWEPHPTSLRIVNWIYAYALVANRYDDQVFLGRWRISIYQQLEYLSRHVKYSVTGTELIKIVKALIIGYLFFGKRDSLLKWEALFWEQFEEQILNDGGHYERSPMYHAQVLADLLECYALLQKFKRFPPSGDAQRTLQLMARFLDDVTFPEGDFAMFNDSASTEATSSDAIRLTAYDICRYDSNDPYEVGRKRGQFPDTGYFVWNSNDDREMIVIDAGPPSADSLSAHAHCDMLSYELYFCGRQFITDSGVHGYEGDPFREYCRSTRAHNTVMFDGIEQSRVKGAFGMGRRAKLNSARSDDDPRQGFFTFEGEYERHDRKLTHRRHITRRYNDESKHYEWMVEDVAVSGRMDVASSFIHIHPLWTVKALPPREFNKRQVMCESGSDRVLIEAFAEERDPDPEEDIAVTVIKGGRKPIQGWFFSDFGQAIECPTIRFDFRVHIGDKFGYRIRVIN